MQFTLLMQSCIFSIITPVFSVKCVRVLSLRHIHGFFNRALFSLSSACLVSCWSLVFGSRHSCLKFEFHVGVRTLVLRVWSRVRSAVRSSVHVCFVVARSSCFIGCAHSYYILCCVARSLCFSLAACFHVVMSCVNTWLMSFLINCVFVSCFAHGWWFVLLAMCLCYCFVRAHGLCLGFLCAMCSHVNCLDPTHLVTWLLVNLPHLSSLVTLLICSLYNLLVFAVLCQFIIVSTLVAVNVALPCLALPAVLLLPYGVVLVSLFCFWIIKSHSMQYWVLASSIHPTSLTTWLAAQE